MENAWYAWHALKSNFSLCRLFVVQKIKPTCWSCVNFNSFAIKKHSKNICWPTYFLHFFLHRNMFLPIANRTNMLVNMLVSWCWSKCWPTCCPVLRPRHLDEGNLIISFVIERYFWVEWDHYEKYQKSEEKEEEHPVLWRLLCLYAIIQFGKSDNGPWLWCYFNQIS